MAIIVDSDSDGEMLPFDGFPVEGAEGSVPAKVEKVVPEAVPGMPSMMECMVRIGRRCGRRKPVYADTFMVGSADDLEVIERYEAPSGQVTIGYAEDGEIEYNLVPDEYRYSAQVNGIVEAAIAAVRDEYRRTGGSMDRARVIASAERAVSGHEGAEEAEVSKLCEAVHRYTVGLGIFDILLSDPRLEDVYVDAPCDKNRIHVTLNQVSGCNSHVRCRTNLIASQREVRNLISILMRDSGLPFCELSPVLETDMCGGSARATVVGYPMSPNGDSVAIRRHSDVPWTLTRLIGNGTIDARTAGLLSYLVDNRSTFLICGARGAGKSSLLSAMLFEFPISQRILTIEDTIELPGDRMRSMGYKVQSMLIDDRMDGDTGKRADEALRVSLRLGESAIVLGEVRGEEAKTLYQSMRAGRAGSSIMGTIHGDSARTVFERVVGDLGVSPESFMATDFLVTMGTVRERGSVTQSRKMSEIVATAGRAGEFVDISADAGLFEAPAVRRIMRATGTAEQDVADEISARAGMRAFLAEMAEAHGAGFYGPEWIALANDHLSKCISAGDLSPDEAVSSFKERFKRFSGVGQ
jgi:flagellar protein FlaI